MSDTNAKITEEIRAKARELLSSGEIAAFLGFTSGSLPMTTRPFVAKRPGDADKLIWNSFCVMNLANYLPALLESLEPPRGPKDPPPAGPLPKVGVVATGCCSRNIVVQMQERQVDRSRLVILGVSSRGMVDRKKVMAAAEGREPLKVEEGGHTLKVSGRDYELEIDRWSAVRDNCLTCAHNNPVISDYLIGPVSNRDVKDRFAQIEAIEAMPANARWKWFTDEIASCIRCYACRNACPLCYCPTCFVDDSRPQWVGKSTEPADTALFHILRAFHCAGRCTDCGACESACPMGIKMRLFTRKLSKDAFNLFGAEAGLDPQAQPPLATYRPDDPEEFLIVEEKK
ncbi:MAG: 4Fe-4S dicluster domain-containing protein [Desulfobacteraceae bacterium]|nr:4Fe-4S dicluster domain-containing protein [Desulfobacteraceae bacterium]